MAPRRVSAKKAVKQVHAACDELDELVRTWPWPDAMIATIVLVKVRDAIKDTDPKERP